MHARASGRAPLARNRVLQQSFGAGEWAKRKQEMFFFEKKTEKTLPSASGQSFNAATRVSPITRKSFWEPNRPAATCYGIPLVKET